VISLKEYFYKRGEALIGITAEVSMHLLQERRKGTEKASPIHTLFHR